MNKRFPKKTLKGFYDEAAKRKSGFYSRPGGLAEKLQNLVLRMVINALQNRSLLLDVGCGRGRYLVPLIEHGVTYVGLDSSKEMLKIAKSNVDPLAEPSFFLVQGDLEHLPFANSSFDSAICIDVLHLFTSKNSRKKVVGELMRALKPNGEIVVEIKNKLNFVFWWVLSKTNPPGMVQPVTPMEMKFYLKTIGFNSVQAKGVMFLSPWLSPLVILKASRQDSKEQIKDMPTKMVREFR